MIRPEELRIGNIVELDGIIIRINSGSNIDSHRQYTAVPLSEDWFLKVGFKYSTEDKSLLCKFSGTNGKTIIKKDAREHF